MVGRLESVVPEIVRLHVDEGWTHAEIADLYGVSREAIRLRIKKAGGESLTRKRQRELREIRRFFAAVAYVAWRESRKPRHGTRYSYQRGCSCADCLRAAREYSASLRARGGEPPSHSSSGYINFKCRCPICSNAHSNQMAISRAQRRLRKLMEQT